MTFQKYTDDLVANACKGADLYDKEILNDLFIEGVDTYIRYSFRHKWAQNPPVQWMDISFQAESLLSIYKRAASTPRNDQKTFTRQILQQQSPEIAAVVQKTQVQA